jgi:hypothetical protein
MRNRGLRSVVWGLAGFVVGAVATFFGGLAFGELFQMSQFEGAFDMQVAFFLTPIGALLGMVAGVVAALMR